ncbi:hypothetical protein TTHERM_00735370 (macronuclear) [Tetrahymena thermophila SB210]|uniref:Uncharacterized protein n=1 Tax=Tetrahymena thermophila (strain SB210) TaxID=312017 RepID=Q231V9_TETTS|nr:hypothetical protein TTHERM_00735370 [Tetrahymena thermophila SB210]EAR91341.2 hypothetical protein TTHERM_00735370 [Tetrahymena thermophila SB210]|eukprot:XP_001011586.2 hypothetical protein TTHERM_00735370 [Tetrahymena thermophila SB210]
MIDLHFMIPFYIEHIKEGKCTSYRQTKMTYYTANNSFVFFNITKSLGYLEESCCKEYRHLPAHQEGKNGEMKNHVANLNESNFLLAKGFLKKESPKPFFHNWVNKGEKYAEEKEIECIIFNWNIQMLKHIMLKLIQKKVISYHQGESYHRESYSVLNLLKSILKLAYKINADFFFLTNFFNVNIWQSKIANYLKHYHCYQGIFQQQKGHRSQQNWCQNYSVNAKFLFGCQAINSLVHLQLICQ